MQSAYNANVVLDLEFTTIPRGSRPGSLPTEIIEIGAIKLEPKGRTLDTFTSLVRPTLAHGVTGAVRYLTCIDSKELASAHTLDVVLARFAQWIGPEPVRMVTWSGSDEQQLRAECATKGIAWCLPNRWLDIQPLYSRLMGLPQRHVALEEAAWKCGISMSRRKSHRALYDSQITAEVFNLMAKGSMRLIRKCLEDTVCTQSKPLSSSIAERCGGLLDLLTTLQLQQA